MRSPHLPTPTFDYTTAFSRNLGLISHEEQQLLRTRRLAIAGMGGVGGLHLVTLLRMGFSKFNIADFDSFELANFNRQYGANVNTLGRSKVEVMAEIARLINPEADLRLHSAPLTVSTVGEFLKDSCVFVDGMDAFEIRIRRALFMTARHMGISAVTAGPIGFGTAWIHFSPAGMSFDDYFGYREELTDSELFVRFIAGLCPRFLHLPYLDRRYVDLRAQRGPSSSLACQLCAGVIGAEVLKIVLKRGPLDMAPVYHQFDAYRGSMVRGRLWGGSRNPRFQLIKWWMNRQLARGSGPAANPHKQNSAA